MEKGDKVIFEKRIWEFPKKGTVIAINEKRGFIAVKRLFRVYFVYPLSDYIIVYKRNKK